MERNTITQMVCALLGLVFMTILLPMEVEGANGVATCQYRVHQSHRPSANDWHCTIKIKEGKRTVIEDIMGIRTKPVQASGYTAIPAPDKKSVALKIKWPSNIPFCTTVDIEIDVLLNGVVCRNQQEIIGGLWSLELSADTTYSPWEIPDHGWYIDAREETDTVDTHPFELHNAGQGDFYVRDLQLHWGYEGLVGDDLFDFGGWTDTLGDSLLSPDDSIAYDIVIPAQDTVLVHIHGHYEIWSGPDIGDSLLGECWFHHYDFEWWAAEMGEIVATAGNNGNVVVSWSTHAEVDMAGFNIHRSTSADGGYAQINDQLIEAQGSAIEGASYSFADDDVVNGVTYYYWVEDVDIHGRSTMHGPVSATPGPSFVDEGEQTPLPTSFGLAQNYPNPFNPTTEIRYDLPVDCRVKLEVYNTAGQKVATLVDEHQQAGSTTILWDSREIDEISSGIYLYRIQAGAYTATRKMVLLR